MNSSLIVTVLLLLVSEWRHILIKFVSLFAHCLCRGAVIHRIDVRTLGKESKIRPRTPRGHWFNVYLLINHHVYGWLGPQHSIRLIFYVFRVFRGRNSVRNPRLVFGTANIISRVDGPFLDVVYERCMHISSGVPSSPGVCATFMSVSDALPNKS